MKKLQIATILLLVSISSTGCVTLGGYKVHPGAGGYISGPATTTQVFISQSYDTLSAADIIIQTTRADFTTGKFPSGIMPQVRAAFNDLVNAYNTAQGTWYAYNQAVVSGQTPGQAGLTTALTILDSKLLALTTAKGGQ